MLRGDVRFENGDGTSLVGADAPVLDFLEALGGVQRDVPHLAPNRAVDADLPQDL